MEVFRKKYPKEEDQRRLLDVRNDRGYLPIESALSVLISETSQSSSDMTFEAAVSYYEFLKEILGQNLRGGCAEVLFNVVSNTDAGANLADNERWYVDDCLFDSPEGLDISNFYDHLLHFSLSPILSFPSFSSPL
jgi:hypothetical protein